MATVDLELQRLERDALRTASRTGEACAIYNLNRAGRRLLVIRSVADGNGQAPYAGPFEPVPLWQSEFPDYPADAMPALPSGWIDRSWHCEPCPSFLHEETGLLIWCDYPDADKRENPNSTRFVLVQLQERHPSAGWQIVGDESCLLACDEWQHVLPAALAKAFVDELESDLTPEQWVEMRRRNALPDYAGPVCASHDFCDANMPMDSAFTRIMGRDALPDNSEGMADADCALWSSAWNIAKARYLTAAGGAK